MTPLPTVRTAAVVAAVAPLGLVFASPMGWFALGAIIATLFTIDAARTPAPWTVEVSRQLPQVLALDHVGQLTWRIGNPSNIPLTVQIADELAPSLGAQTRRAKLVVARDGRAEVMTQLRPQRRGTFRPTLMTVRVRGPWGFVDRQADRDLPATIEVHPRFRSRAEAELRIRRGRLLGEGRRSIRRPGSGTEFEALREYVQGDPFRHVDWSATARAGHPIVRTYRLEQDRSILILLDCGRVVAGTVERVPRLDHGMDAALALATVASALGDRVGLLAYGQQMKRTVPPRRDSQQLQRLSRALHTLEPELAASDHQAAVREVLVGFRRRSLVVILTDLLPGATDEFLAPALRPLLRHHRVIVAGVSDPVLSATTRTPPTDVGSAYQAAGAAKVLHDRSRVVLTLRRLGVEVIDQPPSRFAASVADAYLDMKGRGGW